MPPLFLILLFLAIAAYGQMQQRVAVINTLDDGEPPIKNLELTYLTDKLRETASNVLPKEQYGVMTTESIVAFFGSHERLVKVCNESSCLVDLGRKVSADYVAQAMIGRFGNDLTIRTELYDTKSGTLVGSFTGNSKDIYGLLTLIDEKAPDLFKKLLISPSSPSVAPPAVVTEKVSGLEKMEDYKSSDGKSFTDNRDGKKYKMIKIGSQTWLAENLNYNAKGSKCYENQESNCQKYGKLYDWETAMKACPKSWHLPSKSELEVLMASIGSYKTAGKFLKAASNWKSNGNGQDTYRFSALPGGLGSSYGDFSGVGSYGNWWSATEDIANSAYYLSMSNKGENVYRYYGDKYYLLLSVRCVQDN